MRTKTPRNGFVLVVVLAVSLITISLSLFLIKVSKQTINDLFLFNEKVQSDILLNSFLSSLMFKLAGCKLTCNSCLIQNKAYPITGEEIKENYGNYTIIFSIKDARSMIFLRNPPPLLVENLLKHYEAKNYKASVDSLLDWLDQDDIPRPNGAECNFYRSQKKDYCPRNNRALQSKYELLDIKDFNQNIVDKISCSTTIYSDGLYNINTMNDKLLKAWPGMNNILVTEILNLRKNRCIKISDFPSLRGVEYSELLTDEPLKIFSIRACCKYKHAVTCAKFILDLRESKPKILNFQYLY